MLKMVNIITEQEIRKEKMKSFYKK